MDVASSVDELRAEGQVETCPYQMRGTTGYRGLERGGQGKPSPYTVSRPPATDDVPSAICHLPSNSYTIPTPQSPLLMRQQ
jgi:hypothetical protein